MRVSIWQQFSSNHSAGFSLVAEFKSVVEAENAHTTMLSVISAIAKYYEEHWEELDKALRKGGMVAPTPIERDLARQYNLLSWDYSVDWASTEANERVSNQGLYRFQNIIFLSDPIDTWLDAQPFYELLENMGGKVIHAYAESDEPIPVVNLNCNAPDEAQAVAIVKNLASQEIHSGDVMYDRIFLADEDIEFRGRILSVSTRILCEHINTFGKKNGEFVSLADLLPILIAYLGLRGCKDFDISISSKVLEQ